jgi:hypothetical protein
MQLNCKRRCVIITGPVHRGTVMAVIDVVIQPDGRTRVWFDCRIAKPRPEDERRIEQALANAMADDSAAEREQAN